MMDAPEIEKILSIALRREEFADIFIEKKKGTGITLEAQRIEKFIRNRLRCRSAYYPGPYILCVYK